MRISMRMISNSMPPWSLCIICPWWSSHEYPELELRSTSKTLIRKSHQKLPAQQQAWGVSGRLGLFLVLFFAVELESETLRSFTSCVHMDSSTQEEGEKEETSLNRPLSGKGNSSINQLGLFGFQRFVTVSQLLPFVKVLVHQKCQYLAWMICNVVSLSCF